MKVGGGGGWGPMSSGGLESEMEGVLNQHACTASLFCVAVVSKRLLCELVWLQLSICFCLDARLSLLLLLAEQQQTVTTLQDLQLLAHEQLYQPTPAELHNILLGRVMQPYVLVGNSPVCRYAGAYNPIMCRICSHGGIISARV